MTPALKVQLAVILYAAYVSGFLFWPPRRRREARP